MGIILMPLLMMGVALAAIAIATSGAFSENRGMQNKYLLILLGFIFAIIEMIIITVLWVGVNTETYAFTPMFHSFFLSMGLSILAIILSFIKNIIVEKINNVLAVSAALILILSFLGFASLIYSFLGITTHY